MTSGSRSGGEREYHLHWDAFEFSVAFCGARIPPKAKHVGAIESVGDVEMYLNLCPRCLSLWNGWDRSRDDIEGPYWEGEGRAPGVNAVALVVSSDPGGER